MAAFVYAIVAIEPIPIPVICQRRFALHQNPYGVWFQGVAPLLYNQDGFIATIYGGLDMQNHRLSPDDPSAGLLGGHAVCVSTR